MCVCDKGRAGDGATCEDVDECTEGTHDCDPAAGKCTNLDGSRACGCQPGWEFAGDGTTACGDIDECAEAGGGSDTAHGECLNASQEDTEMMGYLDRTIPAAPVQQRPDETRLVAPDVRLHRHLTQSSRSTRALRTLRACLNTGS